MEQRTKEWFKARLGCLTASNAWRVCNRTARGAKTAEYEKYMDELTAEILSGQSIPHPTTPAMQWGIDHEAEARGRYELTTGNIVQECGFILHPSIPNFGASPDGLVGTDGLLEIKCPTVMKTVARWKEQIVPPEHRTQMIVQLACTGRKWCDFVSYDPRFQGEFEKMQFFLIRFEPTEDEIQETVATCQQFLAELYDRIANIRAILHDHG